MTTSKIVTLSFFFFFFIQLGYEFPQFLPGGINRRFKPNQMQQVFFPRKGNKELV
jgi:hypothetical protein